VRFVRIGKFLRRSQEVRSSENASGKLKRFRRKRSRLFSVFKPRETLDRSEYIILSIFTILTVIIGKQNRYRIGLWLLSACLTTGCGRSTQTLNWPDRRPIGVIFLARDNTKWSDNPRGWFGDQSLNIHTKTGIETFRDRLVQTEKNIVQLAADVRAQGVIIWDIEGEQFPHPTGSFVGDPRLLNRLAPEMDSLADEFFSQLAKAGLRTGVLIRPQRASLQNGELSQKEIILNNNAILAELGAKIDYARQRWGCTLFYVDSNFSPWNLGLYSSNIFRQLHEKYPDILLIPEYENADYFDCTAPYFDPAKPEKAPGTVTSAAQARPNQPHAFSAIYTGNVDPNRDRQALTDCVAKGDIILYRGWWKAPELGLVEKLAEDAVGGPSN
jgi:hypothetical protein